MNFEYLCLLSAILVPFTSTALLATDVPILNTDNSQAFAQYTSLYSIPTVIARFKAANRPDPVVISHPIRTHPNAGIPGEPTYPPPFLVGLALNTDLVVLGEPGDSKSLVKDDNTFIYSNYQFAVDQVLSDQHGGVERGDKSYVTRVGGSALVEGTMVKAVDPEFLPFVARHRYLLFLNRLPHSVFYQATAPASFAVAEIDGARTDAVVRLNTHPVEKLPESYSRSELFIKEVSDAIADAMLLRSAK